MNEKETAEAIIKKYKNILPRMNYQILEETAINCAKAEVQAIINSNPHSNPFNTEQYSTMTFWQGVFEEIK